jgi:DNA-binding winged helix-turn-helix (wHTH) protein
VIVRFGSFEVNLRSGELRKDGLRIRLPGQPFKILAILLEQAGEAVSRDQIKKELWPDDTFVDFEHSLNSAVKKLREALSDSADHPRYIETVPRLGYRFIAPIKRVESAPVADTPPSLSASAAVDGREPPQAPADQGPRIRRLRAVGFGALLAALAAAAFFSVRLKRTRQLPFEKIKTTRLTSAGQAFKAAISPDGRYIAHT